MNDSPNCDFPIVGILTFMIGTLHWLNQISFYLFFSVVDDKSKISKMHFLPLDSTNKLLDLQFLFS